MGGCVTGGRVLAAAPEIPERRCIASSCPLLVRFPLDIPGRASTINSRAFDRPAEVKNKPCQAEPADSWGTQSRGKMYASMQK